MTTSTASPGLAHMDTGTRLAVDRTRLAYERTLMAWVRTASLISFGFTIHKFFQYQIQQGQRDATSDVLIGPREFALIMISIGIVSLVVATLQHQSSLRAMRSSYGADVVPFSTATLVGALFAVLGVLSLVAVLLRQ